MRAGLTLDRSKRIELLVIVLALLGLVIVAWRCAGVVPTWFYYAYIVASMDIRIADYIQRGERVLSTECILCQACISVCPAHALEPSFGLDVGSTERSREIKV